MSTSSDRVSRAIVGICLLLLSVFMLTDPCSTHAGDWPQILGPNRDGRANDEKLLDAWPSDGPRVAWTQRIGLGYAGVAVVGEQVLVFHRYDDVERLESLGADDGRRLWKADFVASYGGGINSDTGPRCVPVVHKNRVYVYGAGGDLHCVSLEDGDKIWSRTVAKDYGAPDGYFGAGSTPIVTDNRLLLNVGGQDGAGIVAFSLETGKTLWQATDELASYSSPTAAKIDGKTMAIFVTRLNIVAVDPADGTVKIRRPFGLRGPTVNAATPLVFDKHLFVSASYGIGAELHEFDNSKTTQIWQNDAMSSQYTTCVYHNGYLYGVDGREDAPGARLRCLEAKTGNVQWTVANFGVAHIILADDKLLIQKVEGELVLAEANPKEYRKLASADLSLTAARALPALASGKLYVRGNGELKCVVVGE